MMMKRVKVIMNMRVMMIANIRIIKVVIMRMKTERKTESEIKSKDDVEN